MSNEKTARHTSLCVLAAILLTCGCSTVRTDPDAPDAQLGNDPERCEWFMDQALGMFVHWSVDSQLGSVISHSMVGASDEYLDRFVNDLPKSFYPDKFDPDQWARLAKLAGMKYVVFTTKHHSGFCMYDTKTTDFNVMNTPYGRDITRQTVKAFRRHGVSVGFYFSPDDFWILYKQGKDVSRRRPEALPTNNPELMAHNKAQIRELLSNYGPIDMLFLDGEPDELKQLAWRTQPDILVTRGEMETPEQKMPDEPMPGPWEACFTLGTQWHLWLFINGEAIYEIRPWHVIREGYIWFTKAKDADTVYAFVTGIYDWKKGARKNFTLKSVRATDKSEIELLGQSGRVLEYSPNADPKATWTQDADGLHISVVRAQRIYNNTKWPNPVVIKITNFLLA